MLYGYECELCGNRVLSAGPKASGITSCSCVNYDISKKTWKSLGKVEDINDFFGATHVGEEDREPHVEEQPECEKDQEKISGDPRVRVLGNA